MYTANNIWGIPSSTPNQLTWIQIDEKNMKEKKLQTQQTDSTHTRVLAKHSPGSNNSDDDDDANGISGTNRKKGFPLRIDREDYGDRVCFSCFCFRSFFSTLLPVSLAWINFFPIRLCVCVSNAGALKVENRENIFRFAQHLFYFPVLTSDFIFIYFFVICCYCIPSRSPALSSVFNCRRLCSLEGTLFRSGFVSIEFLWTAKEKQKMWPGCLTSPLLCLVSTPIFYTLFPKQKISVKL